MKTFIAALLLVSSVACGSQEEADTFMRAQGGNVGTQAMGGAAGSVGGAAGQSVAVGGMGGGSVQVDPRCADPVDAAGLMQIDLVDEPPPSTCVRNNAGYNFKLRRCGAPKVFASLVGPTGAPRSFSEAMRNYMGVTIDKMSTCDGRAVAAEGRCTVQMANPGENAVPLGVPLGLYVCAANDAGTVLHCDFFKPCT